MKDHRSETRGRKANGLMMLEYTQSRNWRQFSVWLTCTWSRKDGASISVSKTYDSVGVGTLSSKCSMESTYPFIVVHSGLGLREVKSDLSTVTEPVYVRSRITTQVVLVPRSILYPLLCIL